MNKKTRNTILNILLVALVVGLLCFFQSDTSSHSYAISIIERSVIYAVVAVAMNLLNGFTGLFSLGQAGFMAIGAYVTAILTIPVEMRDSVYYMNGIVGWLHDLHAPMVVALLIGGLFAAAAAALIGIPILRLKSDYLAIATLGFSEIIRIVITNAQSFTNGALGIKDIPTINDVRYIFLVTAIIFLFITCLINSSYGRAFKAIREDEIAAEAMGVGLFHHKCMAFMLSAFFAGIGGGLYATLLGTVDPKNFLFTLTYNFLLIIVLGGMGSITGSMLGSIIVTAGLEYLRIFDEPWEIMGTVIPLFRPGFRMVIFSLLLMICVLFWRKGIMGTEEFTWDKFVAFCKNPFKYFKRKGAKNNG